MTVTYSEIENAFWDWGRTNYVRDPNKRARKAPPSDRMIYKWMMENMGSFTHAGETWDRHLSFQYSNSGKSRYASVSWISKSGIRVEGGAGLTRPVNRRNDPDRNWGLGRE